MPTLGLFVLFDEYVWESPNGCQTILVKLSTHEFEKDSNSRAVKLRFAGPTSITSTPTNVSEYFGVPLWRYREKANEFAAVLRVNFRLSIRLIRPLGH